MHLDNYDCRFRFLVAKDAASQHRISGFAGSGASASRRRAQALKHFVLKALWKVST
jgi:hypothetical protein